MSIYYVPFSMDRNNDDDISFRLKVEETPILDENKSRITSTIEYRNKGSTISEYEFDALIKVNGNVLEERSVNSNTRFALEGGGAWHTLKFMQATVDVSHNANGSGTFSVYAEIEADKYALTFLFPLTKGSASYSGALTQIDVSGPLIKNVEISADRYGLNAGISFTALHSSYAISDIEFILYGLTSAQASARLGKATQADSSKRSANVDGTYSLVLSKTNNLSEDNTIFFDLDSVNETDYPLDSGGSYSYNLTVTALNGKTATLSGMFIVPQKVTGISCETQLDLTPNQSHVLDYTVLPSNAEYPAVEFHSTDPEIAAVDKNSGNITAKAEGVCQITVTTLDGGFTAACTLNVLNTEVFPYLPEIRYLTVRDVAKLSFACAFLREKLIEKGVAAPELIIVVCEGRNHPVKGIRTVLETIESNCQALKNASDAVFPCSSLPEAQSFAKHNTDTNWCIAVNEWIKFLNELNKNIEKEA